MRRSDPRTLDLMASRRPPNIVTHQLQFFPGGNVGAELLESCWVRVGRSWVLPLDGTEDWSAAGRGPILAVRGVDGRWTAAAKMAEAWIDLPGEWRSRDEAQVAVLKFARRFVNGSRRHLVDAELGIVRSRAQRGGSGA